MLGKTVSHYKILEKLGEGGMGIVYLAEDKKLKRQVAIKILPNHIAHNCEERERFEIEAQAAAALNHPNIATVHAIEHDGDDIFIVMEYIEGQELRTLVAETGSVAPEKMLELENINEIVIQIAEGLQAAHEKGIVHRDIKSSNIMITSRGRAKIMDFGLAKVRGSAQITREHSTLGTAAYMSPEQAMGEMVDHRTDIWSFGVVMYEMLTGQMPFKGDYESAVIYAIRNDDPVNIIELRADISSNLSKIVGKTLEKKPDDRYQKMEDLIADLKTGKEPTTTKETSTADDTILSIVVLPFTNLSNDAENEYFSDGLTEEIITDLSKVGALSVISRTSAMQLKGTTKELRTIGRELNVRYVLEGSVRKAGNSLRITAQLIDAHTDTHLWAEKYSGTMDDVFDLQERVSREIVDSLDVTLTSDEDRRLGDHPIANVRAFEFYLQARQELRRLGPEAIERASNLLVQAVEIEGETPPLRALMAWANVTIVRSGLNRDLEPLNEAEAEGQALLTLAPDAPYGHAILGFIEFERGHLPQAVKHFLSALELQPNDADTLFHLGISYNMAGQTEPAFETSKKFSTYDPLSPMAILLPGTIRWFINLYEDGLNNIRRSLEIDPQNLIIHWCMGYNFASLGQLPEAVKHVTWMIERAPDLPYTLQLQALVDALNGKNKRALESLAKVDLGPLDAHNKFHLSESFAMAGDIERALNIVEQSIDEGFYPYQFLAEHCPFMAPLRETSRWAMILEKAKQQADNFVREVKPIVESN